MTLSAEALRAPIAKVLSSVPEITVAFLFGSVVTERTWAESDLDLAVRFRPGLDGEEKARIELRLIHELTAELGPLGERTDLTDLDRADGAVAFRAIRDGLCVFSRSDEHRVRAIVDVARRYDDETPMRELFREAARKAVWRMNEKANGRP